LGIYVENRGKEENGWINRIYYTIKEDRDKGRGKNSRYSSQDIGDLGEEITPRYI
jgi:hypothetical protein